LIKRIFSITLNRRLIAHYNRFWAQNTCVKMIKGNISKSRLGV